MTPTQITELRKKYYEYTDTFSYLHSLELIRHNSFNWFIENMPKDEDKWISVNDRSIPRDGKEYVTINGNQGFVRQFISWDVIHSRFVNKGQYVFEGNAGTHWMPLPEQPKI